MANQPGIQGRLARYPLLRSLTLPLQIRQKALDESATIESASVLIQQRESEPEQRFPFVVRYRLHGMPSEQADYRPLVCRRAHRITFLLERMSASPV
jgi:hypothetical protein